MRQHSQKKGMPIWGWLTIAGIILFGGMMLLCGGCFLLLGSRIPPSGHQSEQSSTPLKFGESARFGPLSVQLQSVSYGHYSGTSPAGHEVRSSKPGVIATIQTTTADQTKEYTAKGSINGATLKDQFGNSISSMRLKTEFGFTCVIHGQLSGGSSYVVRSDKPLNDTLVFDDPVQAASTLVLTLDAANYGGNGKLIFEIPESEWRPKAPSK